VTRPVARGTRSNLELQVVPGAGSIAPAIWDRLAPDRPFASHRWTCFGEAALPGDRPYHLLVQRAGEPVARASLWLAREEPLPLPSGVMRQGAARIFRRWPLLICRAPLAQVSGLVLPGDPALRRDALHTIVAAADELGRELGSSFLYFDYTEAGDARSDVWPGDFVPVEVSGPGTRLELHWPDFDTYLASLSKSARKDYHRHTNRAADRAIEVRVQPQVTRLDEALPLIRAVEQQHGTVPHPYARQILEQAAHVDAAWITAERAGRLVGCGLLLGDGPDHMLTLLGLDYGERFVYFQLLYAAIRHAIASGVRHLYGGSGAYEFKQRLGFQLLNNHYSVITARSSALRWLARRMSTNQPGAYPVMES